MTNALAFLRDWHYRQYLKYCRLLRPPVVPMDKAKCHEIVETIGKNAEKVKRLYVDPDYCITKGGDV